MHIVNKVFANGLGFIRKMSGMKLDDVGSSLGISAQLIGQYEKMNRSIPEKTIEELAALFNIEPEYITKKLTRLDELFIEERLLENGLLNYKYGNDGNKVFALLRIRSEIETEKLIQKVRNTIGSDNIDFDESVIADNCINDARKQDIALIEKFLRLMEKNDKLYLAYILKAVELADADNMDEWESTPLTKGDFVKTIARVLFEYKKSEQEKLKKEYEALFGDSE